MKNSVFSFLLCLLLFNSIELFSQDTNQIVSLAIKNKFLKNTGVNLLEVEIYNKSKDTLFLPFFTESFRTYELSDVDGVDGIVIDQSESMLQIVPSIKVMNKKKDIIKHIKNYNHQSSDSINIFIEVETFNFKKETIYKYYKNYNVSEEFATNVHFLYNNLICLQPNEKLLLFKTLELNKFEICTSTITEISKQTDGFEIIEKDNLFFIELNLEEEFLNEYIDFLHKNKNLKHKIYNGQLKSNSVKIEVNSYCE